VTLISLIILLGFSTSAWLIFKNIGQIHSSRLTQLTPALFAVLLETYLLKELIYPSAGIMNLSFFIAFALISWLVSIQIMISSLYRQLQTLGIVMFPVTGIASLLSVLMPTTNDMNIVGNHLIQGHIMISIIAYSLIMLSALQALALAYQEHAIRSHHPGGFIRFLPPLHDMETLLFQMLGFGFIFLTTALLSGFFFVEDLFAQHLVHKTVLSIIGWIILAVLLFGRYRFGWRGKVAIRWTITAFIFIMLAYFGSKMVLEFFLHQTSSPI
jgi:ABC-type uncharacterized transport system permease subunit